MSLESELFTWLKTTVALVANRVYAVMAPQDVIAPYLVFTRISDIPSYTFDGLSGLSFCRVQFTAVAVTYASARAILAQLEAALSGFKGSMGTLRVASVFKDLETDSYDPESLFFQSISDYIFTIRN
jgi:hypothetical protein